MTKRVTRQSVSEASAATEQTGDSFEDFVRKSLTSVGAKMYGKPFGFLFSISRYRESFPNIGNSNSRYREIISDIRKL